MVMFSADGKIMLQVIYVFPIAASVMCILVVYLFSFSGIVICQICVNCCVRKLSCCEDANDVLILKSLDCLYTNEHNPATHHTEPLVTVNIISSQGHFQGLDYV